MPPASHLNGKSGRYTGCRRKSADNLQMNDNIDNSMKTIEEDYKVVLRIMGNYFDYLETCGLKDFNKFSRFKWSYDRDKSNGYSYICIRYRSNLMKKCLVKKRAYIEDEDLYRWVQNKELIEEALEEAYQYIVNKVNTVKFKLEEIKTVAENFEEKLEDISEDYEKIKFAGKKPGGEEIQDDEPETVPGKIRILTTGWFN